MKQLIIGMIASLLSVGALADPLALKKRQPDTAMNVTSLELGDDESVINAEGDMGVYGRVYVTFRLAYDEGRRSGTVYGSGRGAMGNDIAIGNFSGRWEVIDGTVTMRHVVALNDGTFNLDIVTFRPVDRELIIKAYVLK
jgi:hypothetical protein|tara:strand:+ start:336 stop:755 length:420 start_codon:yes stop_codon:yes gene_type:complete